MWVVRYSVDPVIMLGGRRYQHVYLRAPRWLRLAEENLPSADRHMDACALELGEHVRPFDRMEDAVAAALRLDGIALEVRQRRNFDAFIGGWELCAR